MFEENHTLNIICAVGIFVAAILIAWLVNYVSRLVKRKLSSRKLANTVSIAIDSAAVPVVLLIIVEGLILALMSVTSLEDWHPVLTKASIGAVIVVATYGLARIFESLLTWQLTRLKEHSKKPINLGAVLFLKNIAKWIIYVLGLLSLLAFLGIEITPLLASIGIGGAAVALALQPTLENFFAGTQIISDRMVRLGDFVEIDENTRGYVTEIGWRSTKMRTPSNNIIIIPNSVLSNSKITNYNLPNTAMAVSVYCGVSYDSNLTRVKELVTEVANEVIEQRDEAVKTFEPWVGFDNFGDSNITFWVWVQARDRLSSFNLKSELIMQLQERFKKENITINYPVRMTYLKWAPGVPPDIPPKYNETVSKGK
jgi:small-conductance mechanosensitive channel